MLQGFPRRCLWLWLWIAVEYRGLNGIGLDSRHRRRDGLPGMHVLLSCVTKCPNTLGSPKQVLPHAGWEEVTAGETQVTCFREDEPPLLGHHLCEYNVWLVGLNRDDLRLVPLAQGLNDFVRGC